jgi:putative glutamine amidotransferase
VEDVEKHRGAQPLVIVSTDVREWDDYVWHATPEQYLETALETAGVLPLMLPSFGGRIDLDALLSNVDGVMLTGSRSNVHPTHYGAEAGEKHGPYDEARDGTTLPLARKAIEAGVPLLAICRGVQELNVALGGTLAREIQEREGALDHRAPEIGTQDERFAIRQPVTLRPDSSLDQIFGTGSLLVNSLHRQGIDIPAASLKIEAEAPDGTIEAVSVRDAPAFAVGVQWHPEYWAHNDDASARIFRAFGDAVRSHARGRHLAGAAAE